MNTSHQNKVIVGRFGAAHGVCGEIKVHSFTEQKAAILDYRPWFIYQGKEWQEIPVCSNRISGKDILASIHGCQDRDIVKRYTNCDIYVTRDQLPELDEGDVYWADLEGLNVLTVEGQRLGTIGSMLETGANDVMVINGEVEHLVPYLDHVVIKVDLKAQQMIVDWDPKY
ncbi:Ribosome maturation factor RimM [Piscirickettsia salmonis]|uniref:Ribosome maturation factor RimM n=1 Tax=Piscirickettsia salmonis TaxID=1238 RepID=A0A1L6TBB5_PISSA|nr:ribosome maturation factor RimM [Piscirickettsia salmonis]RNC77583.1 ribosome maturation factor RimM [Piscirickettsiaceae bacterium NZ-RLO2]AKP73797.1 16S rRNA processing protein RimM [Piscirickettsia salmonis LF-89 = ATCC VR-1361]ALB22591.1 16S rRNA processing protein RimM [Piscirickettsia salmonis]ALY02611.1 16S rRNA processing protein RimM [Piscirickettsia salmonis]AMA42156.1 16S rRNA processing protein RimM [Piscirickettsia salmonis]